MRNTNKIIKTCVLLLVLALVSTTMVAGTFAKYTSEYAGADTALVARWQFGVLEGSTELGSPGDNPKKALDLFKHNFAQNINQIDGADYIIAPGVNDEFTIKMTFLSDVDAEVTVDFEKSGTVGDLPIEYSVDGSTWVPVTQLENAFVAKLVADNDSLSDATANTFTFKRSVVDVNSATEISQTVKWRWAFDTSEQQDETDTEFGNASASAGRTSYILDVKVKAIQVEPGAIAIGAISGTTTVGQTLTAGAITPAGTTVTYQWQSSDALNGTYADITGATGSTYTLAAADADKYIRVVATGSTTGDYSGSSATSAAIGPITIQ